MGPLRLLIHHRAIQLFWAAGFISSLGSQISRVALILFLFNELRSAPHLVLLVVIETLPGLLFTNVAGRMVDRYDKRRIMIVSDLARAALMVTILLRPEPWVVFAMAGLHSIAAAFFQPARTAVLPSVVGRRQLAAANSLEQGTSNLIMIIGPILGAQLYLVTGIGATLVIDAVSYLLGALLVVFVRLRASRPSTPRAERAVDARGGWAMLREQPVALQITLLFLVTQVCVGVWIPLAPFFVREFLQGSDRVLGLQMGFFGFGGLIGALLAPSLMDRIGQGATLVVGLLGEAMIMTVYSLVPQTSVSSAIILVWGMIVSFIAVPFYSLMQSLIDETHLGRVFSLVRQGESAALLLSMVVALTLNQLVSVSQVFFVAGLIYLSVVVVGTSTSRGRQLWVHR